MSDFKNSLGDQGIINLVGGESLDGGVTAVWIWRGDSPVSGICFIKYFLLSKSIMGWFSAEDPKACMVFVAVCTCCPHLS